MNIMGAFIALLFILMKSNEEKYFHIKIIFLILSLIGTLILISKITILIDYNLILNYSKAYFQTFFYPISLVLLYIIGLAITLKKKTTKLMFVFSIIPFLGLFFLKEYGSRYGYYITFSVLYFSCIAISKLKFNKAFLLIFIIINSSILVSPFGIVTNKYDFSMPSANYKDGYDYLKKLNITNKNIITTWSPASTWYGQKVDHQANYSLTGSKNSNFWRYYENSNKERFSSASIINLNNDTIKNKIVIADKQTTNKIDFQIFEKCIEKYNKENIIIYDC